VSKHDSVGLNHPVVVLDTQLASGCVELRLRVFGEENLADLLEPFDWEIVEQGVEYLVSDLSSKVQLIILDGKHADSEDLLF
jgi:hypothetical protein